MHFKELPAHLIPKGEALSRGGLQVGDQMGEDFIATVVERWRGATMSQKLKLDERIGDEDDGLAAAAEEFGSVPATTARHESHTVEDGSFSEALRTATRLVDAHTSREPPPPPSPPAPPAGTSTSADIQELRRRLRARGL